jgi:hypothetical protein
VRNRSKLKSTTVASAKQAKEGPQRRKKLPSPEGGIDAKLELIIMLVFFPLVPDVFSDDFYRLSHHLADNFDFKEA